MVSLPERRRCVTYLVNQYRVSERRACQAMQVNRSSYRYVGQREVIDEKHRQVTQLSNRYPYWGYRKIHDLMRGEKLAISRERVRLIRRREGLQVARKRRKRRLLGQTTKWVNRAQYPNHVWSYDFVFDQTDDASKRPPSTTLVQTLICARRSLTLSMSKALGSNGPPCHPR